MVDYKACEFKIDKKKKNTARVIVWKEFKVTNSFTLETSTFGYELGEQIIRFKESDFSFIGESVAKSIYEYIVLQEQFKS